MAKKKNNPFKNYVWEKDGNGNYLVTSLYTGKSIVVIPRLDHKNLYCIQGSTETQTNYFGQEIPKRYNRFEIMEYLDKLGAEAEK